MLHSRREFLGYGTAIGATTVAGCLGGSTDRAFEEDFENDLSDWETAAAIGPEVALEEFEWEIEVSNEKAVEGGRSLRIWNEGDYDDGVSWAVHPVPVEPEQAYDATVTTHFWSESESFNSIRDVVMRLGAEPPEKEADFPQPGVNTKPLGQTPFGGLREPLWLTEGWREYSFEWTTPELSTDTLYIALGTSVIWETEATHYADDVSVQIAPR